jgi:hypothetical protein
MTKSATKRSKASLPAPVGVPVELPAQTTFSPITIKMRRDDGRYPPPPPGDGYPHGILPVPATYFACPITALLPTLQSIGDLAFRLAIPQGQELTLLVGIGASSEITQLTMVYVSRPLNIRATGAAQTLLVGLDSVAANDAQLFLQAPNLLVLIAHRPDPGVKVEVGKQTGA